MADAREVLRKGRRSHELDHYQPPLKRATPQGPAGCKRYAAVGGGSGSAVVAAAAAAAAATADLLDEHERMAMGAARGG